jgi:hypothetical protein
MRQPLYAFRQPGNRRASIQELHVQQWQRACPLKSRNSTFKAG